MVITKLKMEDFSVASLCDVLGVCRSAYYDWQQEQSGARRLQDNLLRPQIRNIFWEHRRRYGARRIVAELVVRGERCGRRRVARLMDEMGLRAIQPRSWKAAS